MRVLIQRVSEAYVKIDDEINGEINQGMLILLGVEDADDELDADWLIQKVNGLRIFSDSDGKMNLSLADVKGEYLVISQFTLHASTKKRKSPKLYKGSSP